MNNWIYLAALALALCGCDNPTASPPTLTCFNDGTPIDCETGKPVASTMPDGVATYPYLQGALRGY